MGLKQQRPKDINWNVIPFITLLTVSALFVLQTFYIREQHKQTIKEFEYIDSLLIRIEKVDSIHLNWSIDKLR